MAKKQKMVLCRNCNNTMAKGTKICPSCGAKNKKPFYQKWWFILVIIIAIMAALGSCGGGGEKITWEDLILGEQLPEPASNKGRIVVDSEDSLSVSVEKITKDDYKDYVEACEEFGYTVESKKDENSFKAFNEEGYSLDLWYMESSEELNISLDAPIEMGSYTWPNNNLGKLIPVPESTVGKMSWEYDNSFLLSVGETSEEDFADYVNACSDAGFVVDYEKGDTYYRAYDEAGNYISLTYEGNNVMTIQAKEPNEEEEETEKVEEDTTTKEEEIKEENTNSELVDGMRSEFKEAMDTYEDFMNEYCDFMEKYAESDGTDLELLADYTDYMSKYDDVVEAFEAWEDEEMNDKETAYYIKVQTRINEKLLEVAQ